MKGYKYEKYDYCFLYGFLTKKQKEEIQSILDKYIGYPNTHITRNAVKNEIDMWLKINNIKGKVEIYYE